MNRQQKEAIVAEFKDLLAKSQASFLVNYRGLDVKGMGDLRKVLRDNNARLRITKARLMKIAADGVDGIDQFKDDFKDQVGLVFATGEVPPVAKQLVEFSKANQTLDVISGFFESKFLTRAEVEFFASLPSKEVLLAQIACALQTPASNLARTLADPMQRLAYALKQLSEKGS